MDISEAAMAEISRQYTYDDALGEYPGLRFAPSSAAILAQLRATYPLMETIDGAKDDVERLRRLRWWVHTRWDHDGWNEPSANDPLTILREAAAGASFRCVEYSIVLAAVLTAVGLPARTLGLMTADAATREAGAAHMVTEAWLPDRRRWVMADGQCETSLLLSGIPLSGIEAQTAILTRRDEVQIDTAGTYVGREDYLEWIEPYLVFLRAPVEQRFDGRDDIAPPDLMLVPRELPAPTIFQRKWPITGVEITHSLPRFYAEPA